MRRDRNSGGVVEKHIKVLKYVNLNAVSHICTIGQMLITL